MVATKVLYLSRKDVETVGLPMSDIVDVTPAPVLVLGGTKTASKQDLLDATQDAVDAGARGVIYGRNIWQAEDPVAISKELKKIVHSSPAKRRTGS